MGCRNENFSHVLKISDSRCGFVRYLDLVINTEKIHRKNRNGILRGIPLSILSLLKKKRNEILVFFLCGGLTQSCRRSVTYEHRVTCRNFSPFIRNIHAGSNAIKIACISKT